MRFLGQLCRGEHKCVAWDLHEAAQNPVERRDVTKNKVALNEDAEVPERRLAWVIQEGTEENGLRTKVQVRLFEGPVAGECGKHVLAHLPRSWDLVELETPLIRPGVADVLLEQIAPPGVFLTRCLLDVIAVMGLDGRCDLQRRPRRACLRAAKVFVQDSGPHRKRLVHQRRVQAEGPNPNTSQRQALQVRRGLQAGLPPSRAPLPYVFECGARQQ
mmetsp:Transcript_137207/g.438774  ORF Transcript_137207/g.438774 Transcript_137207/m.438774 type:complete len:216 (-) Transcript_137207:1099-1746(-)